MNSFGRRFRVSLFGESHGVGVGVLIDGAPPGLTIDEATLQLDLDARRPGTSLHVSQRREPDTPRILSGIYNGRTTGAPVAVWIENRDVQSKSYQDIPRVPRPSHADLVNQVWSRGVSDPRGGGHSSGRLTAGLVAAGTIAQELLGPLGIDCGAHLHGVGGIEGPRYAHDAKTLRQRVAQSSVHTAHSGLQQAFVERIEEVRRAGDSVGGVVEFVADGVPVALGDPIFDAVESTLAHLFFAIPAVKGVEFGAGFASTAMAGSQHNDPFEVQAGRVRPSKNDAGGVLGGRTSGAAIRGHVAVKPAASIFQAQHSVDVETLQPATLELKGRHDPCIAIRAVPVVQACLRIGLADFVLLGREQGVEGVWP